MDKAKIEADWKKRGFSFGIWIDPPGKVWENYVHDTDELFMIIEGDVELIFRTSDTFMSMLHAKRSLRVEWYIVILILIEIGLIVYELLHL